MRISSGALLIAALLLGGCALFEEKRPVPSCLAACGEMPLPMPEPVTE